MKKEIFVLILFFLCLLPSVRMVRSTRTIVDSVETLDSLELKYVSFSVGFAQTAEVSITFECTGGKITLYLTDEDNFNRLMDLKIFEGWSVEESATGSLEAKLSSGKWYITIWNTDTTSITVTITATLDVISDNSFFFLIFGLGFTALVSVGIYFLIKRRKVFTSSTPSMPPIPPPERYCPDCGLSVAPDLNYCGNCGARLTLTLSTAELNEISNQTDMK